MGFSDFKVIRAWWNNGVSASYSFIGDTDVVTLSSASGGSSVLHSSLTNTLTESVSGLRCKMLGSKFTNGWAGMQHIMVLNSSSVPQFNLLPSTKAVSLKTWVRVPKPIIGNSTGELGGVLTGTPYVGCGLIAKGYTGSYLSNTSAGTTNTPVLAEAGGGGYRLSLSNFSAILPGATSTPDTTLRLRLYAISNSRSMNTVGGMILPSIGAIICSGTYTVNNWYHIRLDVIPGGDGGDLLIAYTGSGTVNETWAEVGRISVPSNDLAAYCPWSNTTYNGYGIYVAGSVKNAGTYSSITGLFDKFEAFVEDI